MELDSGSTYLLGQNTTAEEIVVPKSLFLGWLISTDFHDFELGIPVIGQIPSSLLCKKSDAQMVCTKPSRTVAIFPVYTFNSDSVGHVNLSDNAQFIFQAVNVLLIVTPQSLLVNHCNNILK